MGVRDAELGMTLIEMMAVLAIIGITAGATVLGIGAATRGPSVEAEARRFAARLQSVADEAMVEDHGRALTWDANSYGFLKWNGRGWQSDGEERHASHRLPAGIDIMITPAKPPLPLGAEGSGMPAVATIRSGQDRWMIVYDGLTASAIPAPLT